LASCVIIAASPFVYRVRVTLTDTASILLSSLGGISLVERVGRLIEWCDIMPLHEIVLPETKPETEWVRGRSLQKGSPLRTHSRLQGALTMRLDQWATGRGEVGPQWRFRVAPPGEVRRPLVPDVAYASNERLRPLSDEELELPPLATRRHTPAKAARSSIRRCRGSLTRCAITRAAHSAACRRSRRRRARAGTRARDRAHT